MRSTRTWLANVAMIADAQRLQVVGGDAAPVEHEAFDVRAAGAADAVGARELEAGAHAARQRGAVGAADDRRAPVAEQRHRPIDACAAVTAGRDVDDVACAAASIAAWIVA